MDKKNLLLTALVVIGIATKPVAQLPSYVPTNGLMGYWPFNGNAQDESGNGNDGSINNATLTQDRYGSPNSAYDFNSNAQIVCPQNNIPSQIFSLSVWINQDNSFANKQYVCLGNSSSTTWGAVASNNNVHIGYGAGCSGTGGGILNSITISTGNWIHLVYLSSGVGGVTQIYKNGVFAGQVQNSTSVGDCSSQNLYFGVDIFSASEFIDGKLDDIGIWDRALGQQEITDLYNGCQLSVTTEPISQIVNISHNAQFTIGSSDPSATYQWQTDLGVGFQSLNSVSQYSGTTNDTLVISNVTMGNNNQPFRCIISLGSCSDTSAVAVLTVNDIVDINENIQDNSLSLFPNPTQNIIHIKADSRLIGESFVVIDKIGKVILSGMILSENETLDLSKLSEGYYLFRIRGYHKQSFRILKE
jgi:hypothetical protein